MKTKYKYFILIIFTIITSILIYNFIEKNKPIDEIPNILSQQKTVDIAIKNDLNYDINNPKVLLNPYGNSPLTALIIFQTNDLTPVTITIKGQNDNDITNTFVPSKIHYIPIYGLYPNSKNKIYIKCGQEEKTITIKTKKLPESIKNATNVKNANDFYFTTNQDGYPVAYDEYGKVRWYLTKKYKWDFTRLNNGYILLGNNELTKTPDNSSSLLEMDLLGKIYYEYLIPGGYHHDVYELNNGNLLVLSNDFESGTIKDLIVEIDRKTGKVIKEFNLFDLIPNSDKTDWINLNSITYDSKTNSIIVCGSKQNQIIDIDYSTKEINWIIGNNKKSMNHSKDITMPNKPSGLTLSNNKIAFINQNNNHLIEYELDYENNKLEETKNIYLNDKCKNCNLSIQNDKYIIVQNNTIKQIEDNEIMNIMTTNNNIYSAKNTKLYAGDIFIMTEATKLGETGISKTANNQILFPYKTDKKINQKYHLKLIQNSNHLIIKGSFTKNDKVQIILDNFLNKKTYNVDTTTGIKQKNNKIYTETYINKQGIYGKHYIFIKINNKIYKLSKYIIT